MSKNYTSWGLNPPAKPKKVIKPFWSSEISFSNDQLTTYLPYGLGRSYGDNCLNNGNTLIDTTHLSRFISFDGENGILKCEAGLSFAEILPVIVPKGWFFTVTPGTKYITVGGAIANDVHGKDHHLVGSFGNHLIKFELLRSNGEKYICSEEENTDLFKATIGGMGLTGLILWAEFKLKSIKNAYIDTEIIKFSNLNDFFTLSENSAKTHEYIVSWVDCISRGKNFGRGLFFRGNHSKIDAATIPKRKSSKKLSFPIMAPTFLLNKFTIKAVNAAIYRAQLKKISKSKKYYDEFFYPLDSINNWNRMYGKNGFFQYQCIVPKSDGGQTISKIIERISKSGMGSFLAVLKAMGSIPSQGLMSFPREGVTLALDFANRNRKTHNLFSELDNIVYEAGGALYPCKDARMPSWLFEFSFHNLQEFKKYVDPKFSSTQWRRYTEPK